MGIRIDDVAWKVFGTGRWFRNFYRAIARFQETKTTPPLGNRGGVRKVLRMTTDNKVNDTTRRAVDCGPLHEDRKANRGMLWHRSRHAVRNQCAVSRREIAQFHERQTELENEHTQWLIDEWTKGCWPNGVGADPTLRYQEFAAHTQPCLTTTPQPKLPAVLNTRHRLTVMHVPSCMQSRFNSTTLARPVRREPVWVSLFADGVRLKQSGKGQGLRPCRILRTGRQQRRPDYPTRSNGDLRPF